MRRRSVALVPAAILLLGLGGCSGEAAPAVGDAPIAKGMVRRAPRPVKPPPPSPGAPRPL